LTGEAVPVSKHPIDPSTSSETLFSIQKFKNSVLYGGSFLLQTKYTPNKAQDIEGYFTHAAMC
jgi:magnesium-transporting ATPase (P-type)